MTNLRRQFEEQGYVVIHGLLSSEEAAHYRAEIQKLSAIGDADWKTKRFECPDGVSKNHGFWPLIDHPKLIPVIREVLGPTARYTQHSDLHAHRGGIGWHRDSACRTFGVGPDWDESKAPYQVARVAIYLQTYAESHSALGVIPGSHRHEEGVWGRQRAIWWRLLTLREAVAAKWGELTRGDHLPAEMRLRSFPHIFIRTHPRIGKLPWPPPQVPVWVRTEPGDCIVFNQRLYHSASPVVGPKYAVFLSYATENEHGRNHIAYYRNIRKDLHYGPLDSDLAEVLRAKDLFIDVPEAAELLGAYSPSA